MTTHRHPEVPRTPEHAPQEQLQALREKGEATEIAPETRIAAERARVLNASADARVSLLNNVMDTQGHRIPPPNLQAFDLLQNA